MIKFDLKSIIYEFKRNGGKLHPFVYLTKLIEYKSCADNISMLVAVRVLKSSDLLWFNGEVIENKTSKNTETQKLDLLH